MLYNGTFDKPADTFLHKIGACDVILKQLQLTPCYEYQRRQPAVTCTLHNTIVVSTMDEMCHSVHSKQRNAIAILAKGKKNLAKSN